MSSLVGRQIKEVPKDAQTPSHIFMLRGGYIRPVSTGIYSLLPLGRRVTRKIERIIHEEMEGIDGQEVLMPVVLPRELWEESGRYASVGPELLRLKDRNDKDMILGMTHEEAVVHLARTEISSYKQLPAMLYQVQTKYRDEARPRAGLIRVREFTMKDGYSFHATTECLEAYYDRCHGAYESVFRRIGLRDVISIEADSGMMGGAISHEFMAIADVGEDTLFVSSAYRANREIATTALTYVSEDPLPLEPVSTPGQKTIAQLASFLEITPAQTGKAVFYRDSEGGLVFAVIRGDLEVNEGKLRKIVQSQLEPANDAEIEAVGSVPGYASPLGVDAKRVRIVFDRSAALSSNLVVGGNEVDVHLRNFNFEREMADVRDDVIIADIAIAREGDPCPVTGEPLQMKRGIEVGNIFQLGTKYSEAMNGRFLDQNGKSHPWIMGCYGMGVGRAAAAVVEQCHDEYGPVWPITIAPFEVHIVALNHHKEPIRTAATALYDELREAGFEVLVDDRKRKAGFLFADADLIGCPFRVVLSPKTLDSGEVDVRSRDGSLSEMVPRDAVVARLRALVDEAHAALN